MATNYTEKIAKVEEAIAKKHELIAKRKAQIEKKVARLNTLLASAGLQPFGTATREETHATDDKIRSIVKKGEAIYQNDLASEMYDLNCEIFDAIESIENAEKVIKEKEQTIGTYKARQSREQDKFAFLETMPVCFTEFRDCIVTEMDESDIAYKNKYHAMWEKRHNLIESARKQMLDEKITYSEYEGFVKTYDVLFPLPLYTDLCDKTDEQIHLDNFKDATEFVIDTCQKVVAITGTEITDTDDIRLTRGNQNRTVINGYIIGTKGKAEIESIGVAGYNIVRWHIRTIVHDRT